MSYTIEYEVKGAVSHGFGLKQPDTWRKTEEVSIDDPEKSIALYAFESAYLLSLESLSDPETGRTEVTVLSIKDQDGKEIDQKEGYGWGPEQPDRFFRGTQLFASSHTFEGLVRFDILDEMRERLEKYASS